VVVASLATDETVSHLFGLPQLTCGAIYEQTYLPRSEGATLTLKLRLRVHLPSVLFLCGFDTLTIVPVFPLPFSIPDRDLPRLWSKVPPAHGDWCRDWMGAPHPMGGYGKFYFFADGRRWCVQAHNAVWVATHGLFPPFLQPDHLCHRTICVNTEHIEWITPEENARRQLQFNTGYCRSGRHRWDEQVPYLRRNGKGRRCRPCMDETNARGNAKVAAKRRL